MANKTQPVIPSSRLAELRELLEKLGASGRATLEVYDPETGSLRVSYNIRTGRPLRRPSQRTEQEVSGER